MRLIVGYAKEKVDTTEAKFGIISRLFHAKRTKESGREGKGISTPQTDGSNLLAQKVESPLIVADS